MLNILRSKKLKRIILWLIAILIVPAFALWGVHYLTTQKKYIATVYGQKVFNSDFILFEKYFASYIMLRLGMDIGNRMHDEQIFNDIWKEYLFVKKAQHDKIKVSDSELIDFMKGMFTLNYRGSFDRPRYLAFLKQRNIVPGQFEDFLRTLIAAEKYREQAYSDIVITDEQIRESFRGENETARIRYIFVSYPELEERIAQDADKDVLTAYMQENVKQFKMPPLVKIAYILAEQLPEDFDARTFSTLEDVAKTLKEDIKESGKFSSLKPLDDLGQQRIVAELALETKDQPFVGPITIDKGSIFFRTLETGDSYDASLDEIEDIVRKRYARSVVKEKAKQQAESIFAEISSGTDMEKAAKKFRWDVKETEAFKPFDFINDDLGMNPQLNNAIFGLKENGRLPEPINIDYGIVIAERTEFAPMNEEQFEKEKESHRQRLLNTRKEAKQQELLEKIKEESNLIINKQQESQAEPETISLPLFDE
jgi:hypothetical protein